MIRRRCESCPCDPGVACRGLQLRRFCELMDPGHPDHEPKYAGVIRGLSSGELAPGPAPLVHVDYGTSPDGLPRSRCCGQ
jgi:hypothetical protein